MKKAVISAVQVILLRLLLKVFLDSDTIVEIAKKGHPHEYKRQENHTDRCADSRKQDYRRSHLETAAPVFLPDLIRDTFPAALQCGGCRDRGPFRGQRSALGRGRRHRYGHQPAGGLFRRLIRRRQRGDFPILWRQEGGISRICGTYGHSLLHPRRETP